MTVTISLGCATLPAPEPGETVKLRGGSKSVSIERTSWAETRFEAASSRELAQWLVPEHAAAIVDHEIDTDPLSGSILISLYELPRPTRPQLCVLPGYYVVAFRDAERVDRSPTIRPSSFTPGDLYRPLAPSGRCAELPEGRRGFVAQSEEGAAAALKIYEAAYRGLKAGRIYYRLNCSSYEGDCEQLFARLSPQLITSAHVCSDARACREFHLGSRSPDTSFGWLVLIYGRKNPSRVEIVPAPPPPPS